METGKSSKYLKYAIGEILLVVIGILIALSLNNWNTERKLEKLENSTIAALIGEFEFNTISLQGCMAILKLDRLFADSIRMHLGPNKPILSIDKMNHWFAQIGETHRCEISTDILEDVRSAGNLNIISNTEIRKNIGKWTSNMLDLQREEDDWARELSTVFYPYTNKWMSWDDVDKMYYPDDPRYSSSKFEFDPRDMLQEFEFSNVMSIHYWRMKRMEERLVMFIEQTKSTLVLMQTELEGN